MLKRQLHQQILLRNIVQMNKTTSSPSLEEYCLLEEVRFPKGTASLPSERNCFPDQHDIDSHQIAKSSEFYRKKNLKCVAEKKSYGFLHRLVKWFTAAQGDEESTASSDTEETPLIKSHSCPAKVAQSRTTSNQEFEESSSSSEDEEIDLRKYFPVKSPNTLYVERLPLDEVLPAEWSTIQNAFLEDRIHGVRRSISDFQCETAASVYIHQPKYKGSKTKKHSRAFNEEIARAEKLNALEHDHPRFNYALNMEYIDIATSLDPKFSVSLYMEQTSETPNPLISHTMTELTVAALLNFFTPWTDIQCLWVCDIENTLIKILQQDDYCPKFDTMMFLQKFSAILVVSQEASVLIRDGKCGLIRSLATVLQIPMSKLLTIESIE